MTLEQRYAQFTFNLICHVPMQATPFPPIALEQIENAYNLLYPIFLTTEFLERTTFAQLAILLCMVDKSNPFGETSFQRASKARRLDVIKTFHPEEMSLQLETNYHSFIVQQIALIFFEVCKKYRLNDSRVIPLISGLEPATGRVNELPDTNEADELIIHIKLTQEFATSHELAKNWEVMESISEILDDGNLKSADADS